MESSRLQVSELGIARAVATAVRDVPGVVEVTPGRFAEAATYGPGGRVRGVAVGRSAGALDIEVHVCAQHAESLVLPELAAQVRSAVRQSIEALGAGEVRRIDVAIDDLRIEEG